MLPPLSGIILSSTQPMVGLSKDVPLLLAGPSRVQLGLADGFMVSSHRARMQDREVILGIGNSSPLGPPMGDPDWVHGFHVAI